MPWTKWKFAGHLQIDDIRLADRRLAPGHRPIPPSEDEIVDVDVKMSDVLVMKIADDLQKAT